MEVVILFPNYAIGLELLPVGQYCSNAESIMGHALRKLSSVMRPPHARDEIAERLDGKLGSVTEESFIPRARGVPDYIHHVPEAL